MKHLTFTLLATLATVVATAQNTPVGMRMEVAEVEQNDNEFTIFTYKDEDGTFSYYLGLGRNFNILKVFRDDITDTSFEQVKECCLWLGATSDEAFGTLDNILDLFDKNEETTMEFQGRAATGSERLGKPTTITCVVRKKTIGGKRLQFIFTSGKHQAEAYLSKSALKQLRWEFKLDKKLHKSQHN